METELEKGLRQWLLSRDPEPFEGLDERARRVYRRLVRRSLTGGVRISLPITRRLLDDGELRELMANWIDDDPPTTRLYWRLPLEFAQWIRTREKSDLPHPAVADLVHWEAVKVDVRNAPESGDDKPPSFEKPAADRTVVFSSSARLGIYHYPVYRMGRSAETWPEASSTPRFLIAFRRGEKPYWRLLSAPRAQFLARVVEGETVDEGFSFLRELYGEVDEEAIFEELEVLCDRGAIRGFCGD